MIQDGRAIANGAVLEADLCIVGGGPAGISIARDLVGSGLKVLLLESGGLTVDPATQALYRGETIGLNTERLDANRSRFLGGSSNCWGGWCRMFDAHDFEARHWIPNSGWPFGREELMPHYRRAHDLLQLGPFTYDENFWADRIKPDGLSLMPLQGEEIRTVVNQFSPPTRFGEAYRADLAGADNVTTLLNSNAIEIETDATGRTVTGVRVRTLEGAEWRVRARAFVLSTGGIENARLMLASNAVQSAGIGNQNDNVGRYFSDHPRVRSLRIRLADGKSHRRVYDQTLALTRRRVKAAHLRIGCHLGLTPEAQIRRELPNTRTYLVAQYAGEMTKSYQILTELREMVKERKKFGVTWGQIAARFGMALPTLLPSAPQVAYSVFDSLVNPEWASREFYFETVIEPIPNRDSRVMLSDKRDALGQQQARVDWRVTEQDQRNFVSYHNILTDALKRRGVMIETDDNRDPADFYPRDIMHCWHHMGSTRMHADPKKGVVDANCQVHGMSNLYVAGSSVFPTVSCDIPTMTLVALALRLSGRLRATLTQRERADVVAA